MASERRAAPGGIEPPPAARPRDWKRIARLVGGAILVLLLIVFIVVNSQEVRINFIFFSIDAGLIWTLLGTLLVGVAAGRLLTGRGRRSP
ncbi:MAG TPA: LapA family protein [Candidatus Dormibacteraeota bacterium]|jgi:uncharacterized integral membrane protein|nr:LapA family protein [Candidatus Dormibacteraeota bacterium]